MSESYYTPEYKKRQAAMTFSNFKENVIIPAVEKTKAGQDPDLFTAENFIYGKYGNSCRALFIRLFVKNEFREDKKLDFTLRTKFIFRKDLIDKINVLLSDETLTASDWLPHFKKNKTRTDVFENIKASKAGRKSISVKQEQLRGFLLDVMLSGLFSLLSTDEEHRHAFHRNHSARSIQDRYGMSCAELFKICFIRWNRGGINVRGEAYQTMWKFRVEIANHLQDLENHRKAGMRYTTAAEWVEYLNDLGFYPQVNAIDYVEDGQRVKVVVSPEVERQIIAARKLKEQLEPSFIEMQ